MCRTSQHAVRAVRLLFVACLAVPAIPAVALDATPQEPGIVVAQADPDHVGSVARTVRRLGGDVDSVVRGEGIVVALPPRGTSAEAFALAIVDRSPAEVAEPLQPVVALSVPDDPYFAEQWNLSRIGVPAAWSVSTGDPGVVVAVVDTGIDATHPDLAGRVLLSAGRDFIDEDADPADGDGHGTHVAGIVAAGIDNGLDIAGIAGGGSVMGVRVLDDTGTGDTLGLSRGIRWAADQGADVINLSLGFTQSSNLVASAVSYAVGKGCLVVAAAGNGGEEGLQYPAAYPAVLSVGATLESDERAEFSQYGQALDLMAPGARVFSYGGPAEGILSLRPVSGPAAVPGSTTRRDIGTSMSAPHVSAAAALLRSAHPTWTASQVEHRLLDTALDIESPGWDVFTGHGLARADRALGIGWPEPGAAPDDTWDGRPLGTSPQRGVVDTVVDPLDVHVIGLGPHERLVAGLEAPPGAQASLELHGPDGSLESTPAAIAGPSAEGTQVSFRSVTGGEYRLVVRSHVGGGVYHLTWKRGYDTRLASRAPSTCAWRSTATISGRLSRVGDGSAVAGRRVVVDTMPHGATEWRQGVASAVTAADGSYRVAVRPRERTRYRVRFEGAAGLFGSVGAGLTITPRAYLTPPVPTATVYRRTLVNLRGTLKPEHAAGKRTVTVTIHKRVGGRWVPYRTVRALNLERSGSTRYSAWVWFRDGARYRMVASVTGDARHAATRSKAVYVRPR